ncbi:MAG: methionine--tRNA ligase subunit beta, partial [Synergistaceae bacterium]|nr:methionine--tRNA ligase subunit beta [Synergistaceae bacterium]
FMPGSALRMWQQLGLNGDPNQIQRTAWNWGSLDQEITVKKAEVLFPRIDIKEWKAQREAAQNAAPEVTESEVPAMEQITIDAFKKLEIRVAQVEKVEVVPKADKLYKIELNLGHERRTIVSSIREFYTPEQLTGMKILVLCNLKPAKFRGIESHGMLLAAETLVDGKEVLALSTVDRDIPLGSQVN